MSTGNVKEKQFSKEKTVIDRKEICLKILEINKSITEINGLIFKELSTPFFLEKSPE